MPLHTLAATIRLLSLFFFLQNKEPAPNPTRPSTSVALAPDRTQRISRPSSYAGVLSSTLCFASSLSARRRTVATIVSSPLAFLRAFSTSAERLRFSSCLHTHTEYLVFSVL